MSGFTSIIVWRMALLFCDVLLTVVGVGTFFVLFLTVLEILNPDPPENRFLGLSTTYAILAIMFYLVISAKRYLSVPSKSHALPSLSLNSKATLHFKTLVFQPSPKTMLLLMLGFATVMFSIHLVKHHNLNKNAEPLRAIDRKYLKGRPTMTIFFHSEKYGKQDISGAEFISHRGEYFMSAGRYSDYQEHIINSIKDAKSVMIITAVELIGYTDSTGYSVNNKQLAQKRADAVQDMLIAEGIPEMIITIRAAGVRHPECTNKNIDVYNGCLARNRRVDVILRGNE